ncbi:NAD-binding protein [Penicillium sp. CMV-2018d]|nr:NAD-binding protein [Penicillium sp. CMV-2018d]
MSTTANRNDPVVVITGAGRGIGSPELEAVAQELIREYNISVETWAPDISDIARVVSVAQEIETRHGRVDVLVNNAGIIQFDLVENVDVQDWWRVMEVNLLGPVVLTRTILPLSGVDFAEEVPNIFLLMPAPKRH